MPRSRSRDGRWRPMRVIDSELTATAIASLSGRPDRSREAAIWQDDRFNAKVSNGLGAYAACHRGRLSSNGRPHEIHSSASPPELPAMTVFGFQTLEPDGTPSRVQTHLGFGHGTLQSDQERAYYASPEVKSQILGKRTTGSGLSANQADTSLAAHTGSAVVLTDESPAKGDPLKLAASKGAKIVYLSAQVAPSGLGLDAFLASI